MYHANEKCERKDLDGWEFQPGGLNDSENQPFRLFRKNLHTPHAHIHNAANNRGLVRAEHTHSNIHDFLCHILAYKLEFALEKPVAVPPKEQTARRKGARYGLTQKPKAVLEAFQ